MTSFQRRITRLERRLPPPLPAFRFPEANRRAFDHLVARLMAEHPDVAALPDERQRIEALFGIDLRNPCA